MFQVSRRKLRKYSIEKLCLWKEIKKRHNAVKMEEYN